MKVLAVNHGSSSLKYQLISMPEEKILAKGLIERIGIDQKVPNHRIAIKLAVANLTHPEQGVIASMKEIEAVGHRVAHGGEFFHQAVIITPEVLEKIEACNVLAPLHNPIHVLGIRAAQSLMPGVRQVAVFDTAFHQTMPDFAYLYALPYDYYEKHGIRRYGFHGISHRYVAQHAAELLGKELSELKLITCHLGNGASIAAIDRGRVVDTSMGFTPLEGLAMGTRAGDLDPAIIPYLMEKEFLTAEEINDVLNQSSGMLGVSGISSDFRDIEKEALAGNKRAELALTLYAYRVKKYIGAYFIVLGGLDALVFTAGVGENFSNMRSRICQGLVMIGIMIDEKRNEIRGKESILSQEQSRITIFLIPTNEELMIAREAYGLIQV